MPETGMKPIRRAQLIEATFECIYRYSFADALIDGIWLYGAFQRDGIQRDETRHSCINYLDLDKG